MQMSPSQLPPVKSLALPVADTLPGAAPKAAGPVIGKVLKVQGDAWIIHDGQKVPAKAEAALVQGDSVETAKGAEISLVFADRSTFALKDKGLVGLDDFTYDPATKSGHETFLVAQGGFNFVSGDIAKTQPDAARLATPVMTLGIRGTTVAGAVGADGATSVALLPDPGSNFVGEVTVAKPGGGGESFTINSAGSGIVGATSGGSWAVSANAIAAVAAAIPAAVAPPAAPPVLPAAPAAAPGGTGQAPTGTGAAVAAAAPAAATAPQAATQPAPPTAAPEPAPPPPLPPPAPEPPKPIAAPEPPPPPAPEPPPPPPPPPAAPPPPPPAAVNHPPTTSPVTLTSSSEDVPITVSKASLHAQLLANAHDPDGNPLTVTGITVNHGAIVDNGSSYTFTPPANFNGVATFSYTVDDGKGGTVPGTADRTIAPVNDAPTVSGAATATNGYGNHQITFTKAQLLANATDVDVGDTLTVGVVTTPSGTVVDNGDGTYTLSPTTNLSGLVTLSYTVTDGNGGSVADTATLTLTTNPINVGLSGGSGTAGTGVTLTGSVSASDNAGDSFTYALVGADGGAAYGTVSINSANGSYSYVQADSTPSIDTFQVLITNPDGYTKTVTVTVTESQLTQSGSTLHATTATAVADTDFAAFSGASTFVFDVVAGAQSVVLGANAEAAGVSIVDASGTTGGVTITAAATTQNMTFTGGSGVDSFVGGAGNDVIHAASNDALIDGGAGTSDVLSVDAINFDDGLGNNGQIVNVEIINITNASSAGQWFKFDDQNDGFTINVTSTANVTIEGSQGNDVIYGGAANDHILGDQGADTIFGGIGADVLTGGAGSDVFVYTAPGQSLDAVGSRDTITDFATGVDHLKLSLSGTHVDVSGFADSVVNYNTGQSVINVGGVIPGEGFYSTGDAAFYIYTTGGTTDIVADGGYVIASTNPINAVDLQFDITGTAGSDTLVGGVGADTITGGGGADTLTGGLGADTFMPASASGTAVVTDFQGGTDFVGLSNAQFGLGSSGTLTAGTAGNYAESASAMTASAQNFSGGTATVAGIVAIDNGANTEVWYTSDIHAATTVNSHQVATLNSVNTTALDNTSFHLAV